MSTGTSTRRASRPSPRVSYARWTAHIFVLTLAILGAGISASQATEKILVVLPGQTFQPGVGIVGAPDPLVVRTPFRVAYHCVDEDDYPSPSCDARIVVPVIPMGLPGQGPPPARRYGTLVSGLGAPTSLPAGGSLRMAFGGGPLQIVTLAPAATPDEVCDSIEVGVAALPVESWAFGTPSFHCEVSGSALGVRYTLFLDDGTPVRAVMNARSIATGGNWIAIDPSFGSAPALHFGAPEPSSDPAQPDEYYVPPGGPAGPPPIALQRFSRGVAFFETVIVSMDAVGPNRIIGVDQGGGPDELPVETTPVTVLSPSLHVVEATAKDSGGNGRIDTIRIVFSEPVEDPSAIDPSHFTIEVVGQPPIAGTGLQALESSDLGYASTSLDVTFGTGLGK